MNKQKRTITNGNGKTITMMMAPSDTTQHVYSDTPQHVYSEVEWTISPAQWRRLVRESDTTAWRTENGAPVRFDCPPFAAGCRYPGRS